MQPVSKILGVVLFAIFYLWFTAVYEILLFKLVVWWWAELLRYREIFTAFQALVNFAWVAGTTIMLVPYFAWVPVWLLKQIVWLFMNDQREKPYEARPYMYR